MTYNISYKKSIQRDLKKLSRTEANRILKQIEAELTKNAENYPVLKGQFAGLRKFRAGDFRIIYAIIEKDIIILRIGHRKDVYKRQIQ